jgi:nucleoside-diphosphate-sugar epimerase
VSVAGSGAPVLVTGASGFVGRHLCRALVAGGYDVLRVSRRPAPLDDGAGRWIHADLLDADAVDAVVRDAAPSCVYHLAGFASGATGLDAIRAALEQNVRVTGNVLLAVAGAAPGIRVVNMSSLEWVRGPSGGGTYGTPYGASKLINEIVAATMREFASLDVVGVRLGMAYGPDEPNERRLVPYVVGECLAGRAPRVSSPERRADFIHIDDVVDALVRIGTHPGVLPASLDLGTGRTSSVGDVVEAIRELTGATVAAHYGAVPARKNDADVADADATAAVLGWRAGIGLRDGLRATIDWHARRGAPTRPHARDA